MKSVLLRSKKLISILLLLAALFCAFWNVKNDVQAIDFKQKTSISGLDCGVKELNSVSIPPVVSKQAIPFMDYQHRQYDISAFSYISIMDELTIPVYRFVVLKQNITRKTHFELLNVYILLTFLVLLAAFAGQLVFECFSQEKNSLKYIIQYIHNLDGQK